MNSSHRIGFRLSHRRLFQRGLTLVALVASSVAILSPPPASAVAQNYRIDLKVLVLDDGVSRWVDAIESQMQVEGVKFTTKDIFTVTVDSALLTDSLDANHALYQAVVVPDYALAGLSSTERTVLRDYEAKFGIREVDAFNYPAAAIGMNTPSVTGFDPSYTGTAIVTPAGKAAGFGYLNGQVPFASVGSYTYFATPLAPGLLPAGATFTRLVDAPGDGLNASLLGVYSNAGIEQLVITTAFNSTFLQFKYLGHGIITWMTRGVHFGYNRNNLSFHFDDAFGTDALWDPALNCTPGEDCLIGTDPPGARMTPSDVTTAVQWMQANNYKVTLPFNSFYAYEDGDDPDTNPDPDPLADSLLANKAAFRWLNHGFQHIYQGCVQDFTVTPWVCTTLNGSPWILQADIESEILDNITKGQQLGLTGLFNPTEYLSGEHSGLQYSSATPGQTQTDNPNFTAALTHLGIGAIGTDASRETGSRVVGTANTIARHPTALFYNTATRAQAIDEYNWFYAPAPDGQCTSNCITALTLDSQFDSYIVPTDAAFDLGFILSNDPRPFYAHVTNLVGGQQALAYPLLESILGTLRTVFTPATDVVNLTLTEAATELVRQQNWANSALNHVSGYVENGQVVITNNDGIFVPFTAPTGSTVNGTTLKSYGGELSAWLSPGSTTGTVPSSVLTIAGNVFRVGQNGTMTISATSVHTPRVSVTGALPSGLTLLPSAGGATISGIPAAATEGLYPLVVTMTDVGYPRVEQVMLIVTKAAVFTSANSKTVVAGNLFSFDVVTSGGIPAPTMSYTGTLPSGVTFTPGANGAATLAGTPALSAGGQSFPITLTATNAAAVVNQSFTLTVTRVPQFTSPAATVAKAGSSFTFAVGAVGAPMPAITMSGTLPSGITFTDLGSGAARLSGTPGKAAAGQSFPLSFTATNPFGTSLQTFTMQIEAGPSLHSMTPARLADTRPGFKTVDGVSAGGGILPAESTLELVVAGRGGLPSDVAAVVLNVTVAEPVGSGFVTVYPCGSGQPLASSLNFTAGAVVPNAVIAQVGTDGKVCLFVSNTTQLIVDVSGYFPSASTFNSMNPARTLDTRPDHTTIDGQQQGEGIRLPGTVTTLQVAGRAGVPTDAAAVVLNVTVTEAGGPGYVTVYPCGGTMPTASNINFERGTTVANLVVAKIGDGGDVCIYNYEGTQLVVDVNGYFPADNSYQPLDPARLHETRPGFSTIDGQSVGANLLPAGTVTELAVTGRGLVPAGASTVVLNVTVTEPTSSGFVTAYRCGIDPPLASNLNYFANTTVAIAVIVEVGSNGKVCLFNSAPTQLIADVNGYLPG